MARILCVTNGLPGMLYSSLELARRLTAAGHDVTYATFPHARDAVTSQGLTFLPVAESRYDEFLEEDARLSVLEKLRTLPRRRQRAVESTAVDRFVRDVGDVAPDLVLIDGEMHEHIIALSATVVRVALLNTFASIWRRPGLPPTHHLARPGVGWRGTRLGMSLLWTNLRVKKWRSAALQKFRRVGCDRLSILRGLARVHGFDFRGKTDFGQWLMPFTYRHRPFISLHALEFEFPHRPLPTVHYVGPMILEQRGDRRLTDRDRLELDELFDARRRSEGRRKLLYAGFGSFFSTDTELLRRLVDAVAREPDWDLIISLGGAKTETAAGLGPLPRNVRAYDWLPQMWVLRQADVTLTHGGINTIDECVVAGVPMLVYCGFETDMGGNAARVWHHGIGIVGDPRRDDPDTIRTHIDSLLRDATFADNLTRLGSSYAAYAADRVAERTVESLLRS
jgi:UDP:flavonoid glycosyltransferase YjiC (YdhE family)